MGEARLPPTSELCNRHELTKRHRHLLSDWVPTAAKTGPTSMQPRTQAPGGGVSTVRLHVGPKPPGFGVSRGVSTMNAVRLEPSCDARFPLKDAERYALPQELRDVSTIVVRTILKSRWLSAQLPLQLSDPLSRAAQRLELLQLVDDPLHLAVAHGSAPRLGGPREVPSATSGKLRSRAERRYRAWLRARPSPST